jgi:hypothetical protein
MAKRRNLARIEHGHMIKTIRSLEKLLEAKHITESTRRHAKEVKELLEMELESFNAKED